MELVKRNENLKHVGYYYKSTYSRNELVQWIYNIAQMKILGIKTISLNDYSERDVEGNTSKEYLSDVSLEEIQKYLIISYIETITVQFEYKDKPVLVGVNLQNNQIFITLRKRKLADISELEKILGLL